MPTTQSQYVEIRKNREGAERPYVVGTRTRVQDIVILHERFGESADEIASTHFPHLSLAQVHGALAYFFEDPEAIWAALREDHENAIAMKRHQAAIDAGLFDAGQPSISS